MIQYIAIGCLLIFLSGCGNMPGQQLCVCADDDYTNTQQQIPPSDDVPLPLEDSSNEKFTGNIDSQVRQKEVKNVREHQVAIGHVYPLSSSVVVCDVLPVCNFCQCQKPCQCKNHNNNTIIAQKNASPVDRCRFESMPASSDMSISEKLNRIGTAK